MSKKRIVRNQSGRFWRNKLARKAEKKCENLVNKCWDIAVASLAFYDSRTKNGSQP